MNNLLTGEYEHQQVATVSWPFVQYEALIPEQIKGDLFVWLYLSLITYKSEQQNLAKNTYTESVKNDVQKILIDKFGKVIDSQTLEKIVNNAEKDFVVTDKYGKQSLKAEVFGFLETYEELFSDKLQMRRIFQDGITGEIVPDFNEELNIHEVNEKSVDHLFKESKALKTPGKRALQNAFKQYQLLCKGQQVPIQVMEEEIENDIAFDEFDDEERQEFFDTLSEDDLFTVEPKDKTQKQIKLNNFAIRYIDGSRKVYNFEIKLFVEKNRIYATSPFDETTDQWLNRSIVKARNINSEVNDYFKDLENQFTVKESKEELDKFFGYKDKVSDTLKHCGPLFRLISSTNNLDAKRQLFDLESLFDAKSKYFFSEVGTFLEYLIEPFKRHNADERQNVTKEAFLAEIEYKCNPKNIDYRRLTYKEIYKNWLEGWDHFKADTADIIISTNITASSLIYPEFINDLFELYDLRNANGHKKKKGDARAEIKPAQEHLDKLLKVSKVIVDIYK